MRVAIVRNNDRRDEYKVVLMVEGQDEAMDENASRPWLWPHLDGWHLVAFADAEYQKGRGPVDWEQPVFPKTRKEQQEFLDTLSGDALLNQQDHVAWLWLKEAAASFADQPDLNTPRGQIQNENVKARIGSRLR